MSAVMAEGGAADAAPVKRSRKKLFILIGAAALVLLVLVAVGAALYLRNKAAHAAAEEAGDDDGGAPHAAARIDPKHAPTYLPLDPFVINLADKNVDRYAQIGITLELDNAAFADEMRAYMPAVRNAILLILAHKSSGELLDRSGKEDLAREIQREAVRPMGIEPGEAEPVSVEKPASAPQGVLPASAPPATAMAMAASAAPAGSAVAMAETSPKPKAKVKRGDHNPVQKVHFSTFIIQ